MALFKLKKKRILIVEDDALLASGLLEVTTAQGFSALNIRSGSKVIESVKKFKPHIILLDLILPGIDGFEVLKRLKADKQTEKIPVFVLSNLDNVADIKSVKALGAEEYFLKADVQIERIIDTIKERLKK